MSRLYGLRANRHTWVDCEVIDLQNALIRSLLEEDGSYRVVGWGLGRYLDGEPSVTRENLPTGGNQGQRAEAARRAGEVGVSWLRTGEEDSALQDPQPFLIDGQLFAHHGEIEAFDAIRSRMVEAIDEELRNDLGEAGESAFLFHLIRSAQRANTSLPGDEVLRRSLHRVIEWSAQLAPGSDLTANLLWTDGSELLGVRFGHPLWVVRRSGPRSCTVHEGTRHVEAGEDYRAVVLASEPVTDDEEWTPVPDQSIVRVSPEGDLDVEVL